MPEDAVKKEHALMAKAREDAEKSQAKADALSTQLTQEARDAFADSDQAKVHAQIERAEEIMRMPTPDALKATGAVVGDPTKGPAS